MYIQHMSVQHMYPQNMYVQNMYIQHMYTNGEKLSAQTDTNPAEARNLAQKCDSKSIKLANIKFVLKMLYLLKGLGEK